MPKSESPGDARCSGIVESWVRSALDAVVPLRTDRARMMTVIPSKRMSVVAPVLVRARERRSASVVAASAPFHCALISSTAPSAAGQGIALSPISMT
jgi:hypothetical protein